MTPRLPLVVTCVAALLPAAAWAQAPTTEAAPPEVDQALRARVAQFFQYHVDGGAALRKAFEMVAEDTKDEYFSSGKIAVKTFKITDIKYAPGFEKATVTLDVTRPWAFGGHEEIVTLPMPTNWKIEEGKWVWFHDKSLESITPMGLSNMDTMKKKQVDLIHVDENGNVKLPENLSDEKTLLAHAQAILGQSGLDRDAVSLSPTQASEDSVQFRNGNLGSVILELQDVPEDIPGLTVSLDKKSLGANENGTIQFRYTPPTEGAVEGLEKKEALVRVHVLPFEQDFRIAIKFDKKQ